MSDKQDPILETPCETCEGKGWIFEYDGNLTCNMCGGSGFSRTLLGQRVLELMRHNFKVLMRELIEG